MSREQSSASGIDVTQIQDAERRFWPMPVPTVYDSAELHRFSGRRAGPPVDARERRRIAESISFQRQLKALCSLPSPLSSVRPERLPTVPWSHRSKLLLAERRAAMRRRMQLARGAAVAR